MPYFGKGLLIWIFACCAAFGAAAQSVITLDSCGFSYVDPQDVNNNGQEAIDTLVYTEYFDEDYLLREFYVDINAFGGQQVDRARVFAVMPDGGLMPMGAIAFGNCVDCVQGFAFVHNGALQVQGVSNTATMNMWIQSFNQPAFALPGNLQTLAGVGRISGRLPFCAIGWQVEYVVYSNPDNTTTEFSTHIICPVVVADCRITPEVSVDCQKDSIFLNAAMPSGCFTGEAGVRWHNSNGWMVEAPSGALSLDGNEGWYYLTVEDDFCLVVDSFWVENPSFAQAGPDQELCFGETIFLEGSGGSGHYWELPDGTTEEGSSIAIPKARPGLEGFYILHAFNEEGCEDTDTLSLTVKIPPVPEISAPSPCLGDTLFLSVLNDTAYVQITWFDPQENPLASPFLPDFQVADFGQYSVTVVDPEGCQWTETFEVAGGLPPDFEYIIQESCDSSRAFLYPATYQYLWETGAEGSVFATPTGGIFQVTVTDPEGCSSVSQVELPAPDGPDVEVEVHQPACPGDLGRIDLIAGDPDRPMIFSIDGGQTYTLSDRFDKLAYGSYSVVVQDDLGCIREIPVEIIPPDTMGVSLSYDRLDVRPNTPVSLTATTIGNIQIFQWLPREIDSGGPVAEFLADRDMDVRIIVRDSRGCLASAGFSLSIVLGDIYVPNAFSPNDDGINDRFTFFSDNGSGEIIEVLRVFDRWGALVFEAREIDLNDLSRGWDGRFNGRFMDPGVYTYYGVVQFGNGVRRKLKGDVALVR